MSHRKGSGGKEGGRDGEYAGGSGFILGCSPLVLHRMSHLERPEAGRQTVLCNENMSLKSQRLRFGSKRLKLTADRGLLP